MREGRRGGRGEEGRGGEEEGEGRKGGKNRGNDHLCCTSISTT